MIASPLVAVEEVHGRVAFRRFLEMPFALHRTDPRWAPPLAAYERWRLDPHRNPFFERGDGEYFLVRQMGRPCGRITAHIAADGDEHGWFGFFDVADDVEAARALVDAARAWLRDKGCRTITGPASFTPEDEPGVQVAGFDTPGVTGRPWHPPWYAAHLEAAGLTPAPGTDQPAWHLPTGSSGSTGSAGAALAAPQLPVAGRYGDERLELDGIAAVPDLAAAMRVSTFELARRAKRRQWDTAVVVDMDGEPEERVPALLHAASAAGYTTVVSPWAPDPDTTEPATVHRLYTGSLE